MESHPRVHAFDDAYLQRLAAGDPAIETHFTDYFGALIRLKLRRRMRRHDWIEDICQETFLRVLRTVRGPGEGLRHAERLGAYVHAVCHNVMLEHLRAATRHLQFVRGTPEALDGARDAESSLLGAEQLDYVRRVIEALPEKDRHVLHALFVEERDKDELCAELGVDRAYLRVLLHRAKQQFRREYLDGPEGLEAGVGHATRGPEGVPGAGRGQ